MVDIEGILTSSSMASPFGLSVLGPASNNTLASVSPDLTLTRLLRAHPPSVDAFSTIVTRTVGKRRERWNAEESPVKPPPSIAICVGGMSEPGVDFYYECL